jgi:hypothetical protein
MSKHTPGPWQVFTTKDGTRFIGIGDADGVGVTDPRFGLWRGGQEREANARLIAAAPDLLEALKWAIERLDLLAEQSDRAETARAAIIKAEATE